MEDQLTHDERLRLEALAQAIAWASPSGLPPANVVEVARRFEAYLRNEDVQS